MRREEKRREEKRREENRIEEKREREERERRERENRERRKHRFQIFESTKKNHNPKKIQNKFETNINKMNRFFLC